MTSEVATAHTEFPVKSCSRCYGTGRYSWNQMHGDRCYGCMDSTGKSNGLAYASKKVAAFAGEYAAYAKSQKHVDASAIVVGDVIAYEKVWRTVATIVKTDKWSTCRIDNETGERVDFAYRYDVTFTDGTTGSISNIVRRQFLGNPELKQSLIDQAWASLTSAQRKAVTNG